MNKRDRSPSRVKDDDYYRRKRDRKEQKKEEKKKLAQEEARQVAEMNIYSSNDNPFNDSDINKKFQWGKKADRDRKLGITVEEAERRDSQRRAEAREELEKLNKRRQQRELEFQMRQEEEQRAQRLNESAQMSEWLNKEDEFMLEQKRRRAAIRIKENRGYPIDYLALNLKFANPSTTHTRDDEEELETGLEIDLDEPYNILNNLRIDEVKELHGEICDFLELEIAEDNKDFWRVSKYKSCLFYLNFR